MVHADHHRNENDRVVEEVKLDARDEELPLGWGLGRPEIGWTVGQVDMIIS